MIRTGAERRVQQLRNSPRQWGQGAKGFGKRVGSGFGQHIVKNSSNIRWRHSATKNSVIALQARKGSAEIGVCLVQHSHDA